MFICFSNCASWDTPPGQTPPNCHCNQPYASYWNVFLYFISNQLNNFRVNIPTPSPRRRRRRTGQRQWQGNDLLELLKMAIVLFLFYLWDPWYKKGLIWDLEIYVRTWVDKQLCLWSIFFEQELTLKLFPVYIWKYYGYHKVKTEPEWTMLICPPHSTLDKTRMHSSRMRTARFLLVSLCTCLGGVPAPGGVPAWGCTSPGTPPVDRILDTRYWKYYLAPNFVCRR